MTGCRISPMPPMEPMNATARLKDGVLDLWAGNQAPTITRRPVRHRQRSTSTRPSVNIHTPSLGGGFGPPRRGRFPALRRADGQARRAGVPIKVVWTREQDMRQDAYRPAAAGKFQARLGGDGLPVALDMKISSPPIIASTLRRLFPSMSPLGPDKTIVDGAYNQPYTIPNYRVTGVAAPVTIPVGSWRSVGNSFNGFFHEGFLDEIAVAGKTDPVELRKTDGRLSRSPEGGREGRGHGKLGRKTARRQGESGIAFYLSFGSWVGEVVQVAQTLLRASASKRSGSRRSVGTALRSRHHPRHNSFPARSTACRRRWGRRSPSPTAWSRQSNFHDFDAMRINQCPEFEVAILENFHKMGGVGEIGTPPVRPGAGQCDLRADRKTHPLAAARQGNILRMSYATILPTVAASITRPLPADYMLTRCGQPVVTHFAPLF